MYLKLYETFQKHLHPHTSQRELRLLMFPYVTSKSIHTAGRSLSLPNYQAERSTLNLIRICIHRRVGILIFDSTLA